MHSLLIQVENYMLPCMNKKVFGVECPGCGVQRSLVHVAKGEFTDAFNMYPAIFTLLILVMFLVLNKRFKFRHGKKIILTLAFVNVTIIVVSYIIKMNTIYQLI